MENKVFSVYNDESGKAEVKIDTIAKIAALAATEVEGVDSVFNDITSEVMSVFSGKKLESGVEVVQDGESLDIFIMLVLKIGYNIREVCHNTQKKIKTEIEDMVGINVGEVNIRVVNIKADK